MRAEPTLAEIARVLVPGGRLAIVYNNRDTEVPVGPALDQLLRSAQPAQLQGHWGSGSVRSVADAPTFGEAEHTEFSWSQRVGRDVLLGLVASRSYVIELDGVRRRELLARADGVFDEHVGSDGLVRLAYVASAWRWTLQA